jgi:thioredoxin reductase (NADPH)
MLRAVREHVCDVLIIGAGPIGLETAAVLANEGWDVRTVDAGPIGATIAATFPPHTRFFTSPERLQLFGLAVSPADQEKLTGEQYLAYLRQYVATHHLAVDTFTTVTGYDGQVITAVRLSGQSVTYRAAHVVLATGGTDRPRALGVEGENLPHVSSHLGDPHRFAGRTVVIIGGRNSAAESALRCYRVGAQVHLVHRQPHIHERVKFWLRPEVVSLMSEGRIVGHLPDEVAAITAQAVTLRSGSEIAADDVLLQIGYEQDRRIFDVFGVPVQGPRSAPAVDSATLRTAGGMFVVGTATAGTQDRFEVFIENSHDHAQIVAAQLAGRAVPARTPPRPLPEV